MDNTKNAEYYLNKIIEDIDFSINVTKNLSYDEFVENIILNNAISFRFIQISENAKKLPNSFIINYPDIPWGKISGLRNKIVHDYGNVELDIIYDTVMNNLPDLLNKIKTLKSSK